MWRIGTLKLGFGAIKDVVRRLRLGGRIEAGEEPVRNVNRPLYTYERYIPSVVPTM